MAEVPVRVAVRVRPLVGQEKVHNVAQCVQFVPDKPQLILGKDRGFTFDYVFQPETSQAEVYETCVEPLVKSCLEGYNATVFAYGQTGSGKTYTVGGTDTGGLVDSDYGVIPRAIKQIFQTIEENKHKLEFEVHVSYIEIYLEELRDLLDLDTSSRDIHIREDDKGNTVVVGAMEEFMETKDEVMSYLDSGSSARHTGMTNMNEHSSRSHAIFTLYIGQKPLGDTEQITTGQQKERKTSQGSNVDFTDYKYSKFHFVDLAGSERADRTGNVGERFKESVQINSGLLALGNVISALADSRKKVMHVPYRESKVTRLLKDSLGGNARTVMITCLSPAAADFAENLNSLKFATRARNIRNKPVINRDPQNTRLAEMQSQILALREELQRRRGSSVSGVTTDDKVHMKELQEELQRCRTVCEGCMQCVTDASSQLKSLHKAGVMSNNQTNQYERWSKMVDQLKGRPVWTPNTAREQEIETLEQLKKDNYKLKSDLASDEEIFAEKAKQIGSLHEQIREYEEQNDMLVQQLQQCLIRVKKHEDQLFQQQLQLNQHVLTQQNYQNPHDERLAVSSSQSKIPLIPGGRSRAYTAPTDKGDDVKPDERILHSSPPVFTSDRIIQGFRARSQLLVSRFEEQDEVLCTLSDSSDSEEEEEDDDSRQLGRTWKVRKNGGMKPVVPTVNESKKLGRKLPQISKKPVTQNTSKAEADESEEAEILRSLRSSTHVMSKEVKEAELRLHEAEHKLRDLTINIKLKEEFIKELVKSDKEAKEMKKQYTDKVKSMRQEVEKAKKDLEETKKVLEGYETKANYEMSEKQKVETEYKRKVQVMEAKLQAFKRKQKDSEKVSALHEDREKKLQDLEIQIERMRSQQDNLSKRLKDEGDRKGKMEREMQKHLQRVRELEEQTSQQQKILRRKTEEVAKAQRRLRHVGRQGSGDKERSDQAKLEEKRQWLDAEVEKVLQRKQAMEALEEDLLKREEIIKNREVMMAEKSGLEIKKLRSSQVLSKDILRLSTQLVEVEKQLKEKGENYKGSDSSRQAVIKDELHSLGRTKDELCKQRDLLEQKLQQGTLLDPREERRLIELDEGIEALEAAIDFKNDGIASRQHELEDDELLSDGTSNELTVRLKVLPQQEAATLLTKYFDKVVQLRDNERKLRLESGDMEVRLNEQERIIGELGRSLQQIKFQADRRLIEQQKDGEQRIQFLMSKLRDAESAAGDAGKESDVEYRAQQLERDLYYYKKTCRDLKKKLRERMSGLVESSESAVTGASGAADSEGDAGVDETGKQLSTEIMKMKHALLEKGVGTPSQATTPIRLSRKDLRQLSAQEIIQRRSTTSAQTSVATSVHDTPNQQSIVEETGDDLVQAVRSPLPGAFLCYGLGPQHRDSIEQGNNPWT